MDIHDVSKIPEYFPYLAGHKQNIKAAQAFKGRQARSQKTRGDIILHFMVQRMKTDNAPRNSTSIRSSFLPPAYAPCVVPLGDLTRVMIKDLRLETHHRGRYLLLRTVTPTDTLTAVMAIVEDEDSNVLMLQLFNQQQELSGTEDLTEGTIIVVKEPYVKVMADGNYGIRVDHLCDVKLIPEFDNLCPPSWRKRIPNSDDSPDSWRLRGNDFYRQTRFHLAIECYTKALNSSPSAEQAVTIQVNRALAFFKNHQFDAALTDVQTATCRPDPSEKALFRRGQALYYLQRFEESCESYKTLSEEYPENTVAGREFQRASARLIEQNSGVYEFKRMQLDAEERQPPHLNYGTFVGPVSVKPTKDHGRGLFTTKPVKAGELLLCEKAFACAFYDSSDAAQDLALLIDAQNDTMTVGAQAELIELVVQRLYKNASLLPAFIDLHHGKYKPVDVHEVDGIPIVDNFLIERIIQLNVFGCPLSSREAHIHSMRGDTAIKKANERFYSCGIWRLASYINHSCFGNARRSFIGDMMVIRAAKDLVPDTEIMFPYKKPPYNDFDGTPVDLGHWGFKCVCIICEDIQKTRKTILLKRTGLLANLRTLFTSQDPNPARIEAMISELARTYSRPCSEVPRLALWSSYFNLAAACARSHQPRLAVKFGLKALESLGYVIDGGTIPHASDAPLSVNTWGFMSDDVVACWMILAGAYHDVAPALETQAQEYAKISYKICVGEDETFEETYGKLSERLDGLLSTAK